MACLCINAPDATVRVIDVAAGADLIVNADGTTGYVSARADDAVLVLDLLNGRAVRDTFVVDNPEGLAPSADETYLYVGTLGCAGEPAYDLEMLDAQSGARVVGVDFVHPAPYGRVGSDKDRLWDRMSEHGLEGTADWPR